LWEELSLEKGTWKILGLPKACKEPEEKNRKTGREEEGIRIK
jgi:hypothetical protein